ncbi:MAG: hypothetical protein IT235_04960, partial [Bacteroidia bacterium]|nr:hypothetical protein [Bacteroidia bacterium]
LELYDQVVRTQTGGAMIDYIRDTSKKNDEFLLERNGKEAELLIKHIRNPNRPLSLKYTLLSRIKNKLKQLFDQIHSEEYKIGKFRLGGEVHQWMYDRYSLGKLLKDAGFSDVQTQSAFESAIHNWNNFELDGKAGMVRKPDSLFMEAKK